MATVVLVRHGRSAANTAGVLAGRTPGMHLDDHGREQAEALGVRLAGVGAVELVASPLERCHQTAAPIATATGLEIVEDHGLIEVGYGAWQGRPLAELVEEPLWETIQATPSAVTFPDGEAMAAMAARAAAAVRARDAEVAARHGEGAVWIAVSHGDILKAVLADALGLSFDLFQRIHVDPGSVSIVRYGARRPTVLAMNTHAGDLSWLAKAPAPDSDQAAVGGGAGPGVRPGA